MNQEWLSAPGPYVPAISDARLAELMARFRPVIVRGGKHYEIEIPDPRRTAFTWSPQFREQIAFSPMREVPTDHGCGHPALFKPSIAEVLSQAPGDLPAEANAFCIDLDRALGIYSSGRGHRAVTVFGVASSPVSGEAGR